MLRRGDQKTADGFGNASVQMLAFSAGVGETTRSSEMSLKVTQSKFNLAFESMRDEIENNFSNFSILMNKHLQSCQDMAQDPAAVVKKWEKLISEKYDLR